MEWKGKEGDGGREESDGFEGKKEMDLRGREGRGGGLGRGKGDEGREGNEGNEYYV